MERISDFKDNLRQQWLASRRLFPIASKAWDDFAKKAQPVVRRLLDAKAIVVAQLSRMVKEITGGLGEVNPAGMLVPARRYLSAVSNELRLTALGIQIRVAVDEENFEELLDRIEGVETARELDETMQALAGDPGIRAYMIHKFGPEGLGLVTKSLKLIRMDKLGVLRRDLADAIPHMIRIKKKLERVPGTPPSA